eukprot:TRINITY_DN16971_c0_g1_i1.p1 TRINITY_DN16971_c0_g1~~TRINITY_DN16971_c0_g1_i1.p1  ORF type:complete len:210 (+),score=43.30 TRINITY_DN16971_c0_g1_i1:86-631(+)
MCCSTINNTVATTTVEDKKEVAVQKEVVEAPCSHNKWTRARRLRQGGVLLRCQECMATWPTRMELHEKCPDFYAGSCTKGGDCPRPHIYARGALAKKEEQEGGADGGKMVSLRALKDMRKKALKKKNHSQDISETSSTADSSQETSSYCVSAEDSSSNPDIGCGNIVYRFDPYSTESFVFC